MDADEFARMMDAVGHFEAEPVVAIGVSGGADSLSLAILVHEWASSRGGRAVAMTVDHGLRAESATEAAWVSAQMQQLGIDHHVLVWDGEKPKAAIQEKARNARRRLLLDWCRDNGVLHLALGHHANDQVETHLMRLSRGSSASGLAGMSLVREHAGARVIRPLLSAPKHRLEATLMARGRDWVSDPSNDMEQFERVRIRRAAIELERTGDGLPALVSAIRDFGDVRRDLEQLGAEALASSVALYPAGYAYLNPGTLMRYGETATRYALSRLLMAIGGRRYPLAREKLARAHDFLKGSGSGDRLTLGGCLLSRSRGELLVTREVRNLPVMQAIQPGQSIYWDNRFTLSHQQSTSDTLHLGALGHRGWDRLVQDNPALRHHPVPLAARYTLPTLFHNDEIIAVSHLTKYGAGDHPQGVGFEKAAFVPCEPVLGGMFSVALAGFCTISGGDKTVPAADERIDA